MAKFYVLTENRPTNRERGCRYRTPGRFVLTLGLYSPDYFLIWARGIEHALDQLVDHLCEHRPALIASYREQFEEVRTTILAELREAESYDLDDETAEDKAYDQACDGWTMAGNASDPIASEDWGIWAENPGRSEVLALVSELKARDYSGTPTVIVY